MSGRTLTWLRGVLLGGAMVFTTALTGCLAEPVDEGDETEDVAMAESGLEAQTPVIDTPEEEAEGEDPGGAVEGPDPLPWIGRPAGPEDPWSNATSVAKKSSSPAP